MGTPVVPWGIERLGDLGELVDRWLPDEGLSTDELRSLCWDEPGVVLGFEDGSGAVAAGIDGRVASIGLLAVDPRAGFRATGQGLLDAVQMWARGEGADQIRFGGPTPPHLWPGVDGATRDLVEIFGHAGFEEVGRWTDAQMATSFRSAAPSGTVVQRVLDDDRIETVRRLTEMLWPSWLSGVERAIEQGTCLEARSSDDVVGLVCHSVSRAAWIGPLGVEPHWRGRGIGSALLSDACRDLMIAGFAHAELAPPDAWAADADASWPTGFFTRAGATPSRSFLLCRRPL